MTQPVLIVVSGPPGSGKTTLAHALARELRCPAICRDELKEGLVYTHREASEVRHPLSANMSETLACPDTSPRCVTWTKRPEGTMRSALIADVARRIAGIDVPHPARVFVGGVDGVGKTRFADELVEPLRSRGRSVIRASVDGFHHPRSVRYRLGRDSPEGYFRDSFNYEALIEDLLVPLGPGGTARYRRAIFDWRGNREVEAPLEIAPARSILLLDGVFIIRPELRAHWDLAIYLDAPFDVTVSRCAQRDGGSPDVDALENRRYVLGQRLYLAECQPRSLADLVIDNTHLAAPILSLTHWCFGATLQTRGGACDAQTHNQPHL